MQMCSHPAPKIWAPDNNIAWCEACGAIRIHANGSAWTFPETWLPRGSAIMDTVSGRQINILEPSPFAVDIADIAHHQSMMVRFTGAVREFFSVGEHSMNVGISVYHMCGGAMAADGGPLRRDGGVFDLRLPEGSDPRKFWGAVLRGQFHDGTEPYLCDVIAPLKKLLPGYRHIERLHMKAIHDHLGFWEHEDWAWADELVHAADQQARLVEDHVLRGGDPVEMPGMSFIHKEDWKACKRQFLWMAQHVWDRFREAG